MTTQPEALRLADELEFAASQIDAEDDVIHVARWFVEDAAAELRRLARVEEHRDELMEALKHAASWFDAAGIDVPASRHVIAAIDKAQQEK